MALFLKPKCEKCAHYQQGNCLLLHTTPQPTNVCSYYTESAYICEFCKQHLIPPDVIWTYGINTSHHILCEECYSTINTCNSCRNVNDCRFDKDSTIAETPYYITQQVRQGPAIIQQQVRNPKRVQLTCATGCSCYVNGKCAKGDGNSCEKYDCIVQNW